MKESMKWSDTMKPRLRIIEQRLDPVTTTKWLSWWCRYWRWGSHRGCSHVDWSQTVAGDDHTLCWWHQLTDWLSSNQWILAQSVGLYSLFMFCFQKKTDCDYFKWSTFCLLKSNLFCMTCLGSMILMFCIRFKLWLLSVYQWITHHLFDEIESILHDVFGANNFFVTLIDCRLMNHPAYVRWKSL